MWRAQSLEKKPLQFRTCSEEPQHNLFANYVPSKSHSASLSEGVRLLRSALDIFPDLIVLHLMSVRDF